MDFAYDHITEEALPEQNTSTDKQEEKPLVSSETTINSDFQEAYKAISSSPWGARLGGFFGTVVKQVGRYYVTSGLNSNTHRASPYTKRRNRSLLLWEKKQLKASPILEPL
jgi:hypothetical protein